MNIFTLNMRKHALSNSNKKTNKSITFCSNKPLTKTKLNIDLNNSLGVINMATAETTKNKNSIINNNMSTCVSSMNYNQRGLSSNNGSEISKSRNKRKVIHDIINNNNNINSTVNVNITSNIKTKTINNLFHNTNQPIYKAVFPISKFSPKRKLNTSSSHNKALIHTKPTIKKIININSNSSINTITIMKRK